MVAKYLREVPELCNNVLHYWNVSATYHTLTMEAIQNSTERAHAINTLKDCDALENCVNHLIADPVLQENPKE